MLLELAVYDFQKPAENIITAYQLQRQNYVFPGGSNVILEDTTMEQVIKTNLLRRCVTYRHNELH